MSCFFGCFRVKDSSSNLVTPSEPVVSRRKNALSSLFECDDDSLKKGVEGQNRLPGEIDVREFKDENEISKSYGISLETPVKIRNALEKWEDASAQNGARKSLKFDSWIPNASMEKQSDEHCASSFLDSPGSCMTDGHNTGGVFSSSVQRSGSETQFEQSKSESVCLQYTSDRSSISSEQAVSAGGRSVAKPSPYPNTLILPKEDLEDEHSSSNHQRESVKKNDEDDLKPTLPSDLSVTDDVNDEGSLTSWFKPISAKQDGGSKQLSSISSQNRKTASDRPILGMVAAHWNEDEASPNVPLKWWDGNGIPNSTNKYKEDQKVSWQAATFEERLEKALSEESLISQKKPINMAPPFEFNVSEESDTAISHFQSSPCLNSVVSF